MAASMKKTEDRNLTAFCFQLRFDVDAPKILRSVSHGLRKNTFTYSVSGE
jgi:hypothetical protein